MLRANEGPKQRTDLRRDRGRLHLAERREDELVPERRQGIVGRRELEFLRGAGHGGVLQVSSMRLRDGTRNYARQPWTERVHMGPPTSMSNADVCWCAPPVWHACEVTDGVAWDVMDERTSPGTPQVNVQDAARVLS